jgi:hypothetical protein
MQRRIRRDRIAPVAATVFLAMLLAACQGSTGASSSASPASVETSSPAPAASSLAAITPRPTAPPLPLAIPRPTDLPTDGACESGHTCLGLLGPGTYHTKAFRPGFEFTISAGSWENLADTGGDLLLQSIDSPGDVIAFFRQPRATKPDGTLVAGVSMNVKAIDAWLATNEALTVSPPTPVSVGGLSGVRRDITLAPGVQSHQSDCPVQVCALVFLGRSSTWEWTWGFAGPERQRLYLLSAPDGVIAVFVDSLDGTTFETLTKAADKILATVKFDGT